MQSTIIMTCRGVNDLDLHPCLATRSRDLASMSSSGARQTTCQRKRVCKPPLDGCLDEEVNPL